MMEDIETLQEIIDILNEDSPLGWVVNENTVLEGVNELMQYIEGLEIKLERITEIGT